MDSTTTRKKRQRANVSRRKSTLTYLERVERLHAKIKQRMFILAGQACRLREAETRLRMILAMPDDATIASLRKKPFRTFQRFERAEGFSG